MIGDDIGNELDVKEWINSAREDLGVIELVSRVPYFALTCYHCQQAVEKLLKAYLLAHTGEQPQKSHDLDAFLNKCAKYSADFNKFKKICADISTFSTVRYPSKLFKSVSDKNNMKGTRSRLGHVNIINVNMEGTPPQKDAACPPYYFYFLCPPYYTNFPLFLITPA